MRVSDSLSLPENQDVRSKTGSANGAKIPDQSSVGRTEDATDLSSDLQKVQQLKAQLAHLPDVRQEKVEALKKAVQSGTYEVDAGKIADAMLSDLAGPHSGSK